MAIKSSPIDFRISISLNTSDVLLDLLFAVRDHTCGPGTHSLACCVGLRSSRKGTIYASSSPCRSSSHIATSASLGSEIPEVKLLLSSICQSLVLLARCHPHHHVALISNLTKDCTCPRARRYQSFIFNRSADSASCGYEQERMS